MHRVARPQHIGPFSLHGLDQARQIVTHFARAKPRDQRQTARFVLRVQFGHQHFQIFGRRGRPAFQTDGVQYATGKFHMRAVRLAGAVADPDHMARPCHRLTRDRINPAQSLFIFQQQRFVAGIEINRRQRRCCFRIDASRIHEIQSVRDAVGQRAVTFGLVMLCKAQSPSVNAVNIGKATSRKRTQQVQRGRRLRVSLQHPRRIGHA